MKHTQFLITSINNNIIYKLLTITIFDVNPDPSLVVFIHRQINPTIFCKLSHLLRQWSANAQFNGMNRKSYAKLMHDIWLYSPLLVFVPGCSLWLLIVLVLPRRQKLLSFGRIPTEVSQVAFSLIFNSKILWPIFKIVFYIWLLLLIYGGLDSSIIKLW